MVVRTSGVQTPPLLHAALGGKLESVEFFLSDVPHRLYNEFSKSKRALEDVRLKHLMDAPGGFNRAISRWLGADSKQQWIQKNGHVLLLTRYADELVLHCAVMATPSLEANELVEYLVEACPSSLEKKAAGGCTPLMIAYKLGRFGFAKILIEAGADQSTRNDHGETLAHAAVDVMGHTCRVRDMLNLLDSDLRKHLFQQRTSLKDSGITPLHAWIQKYGGRRHNHSSTKSVVKTMKLILEYSGGDELNMLNSAGDTCLHTAVSQGELAIIRTLVDFRPQLMFRENAVGRTPAEVARDKVAARVFKRPDDLRYRYYAEAPSKALDLKTRDEEDFVLDKISQDDLLRSKTKEMQAASGLGEEYTPHQLARILGAMGVDNPKGWESNDVGSDDLSCKVIWDICNQTVRKHTAKRRLVSLNEANDVARRLGESEVTSRYFAVNSRKDDDAEEENVEDDEDKKVADFVQHSFAGAQGWLLSNMDPKAREAIPKCAECDERHTSGE